MKATEVLQHAMALGEGEVINIPCRDLSELERIRISLYRHRRQLATTLPQLADNIKISMSKATLSLVVCLETDIPAIQIINKEGKVVKEITDKGKLSQEQERIAAAMREDGKSEDEIKEYFASSD